MKRYEQIAEHIARQIRDGVLRRGERIPSLRQIRRSYRVSPATAQRAYHRLEARGLVTARPRSGYFVSMNPANMPPKPARAPCPRSSQRVSVSHLVFEILEATKRETVVPFGSAFIDSDAFPLQKLARFLGKAVRRLSPPKLADSLPPGHADLRRAIARRYLRSGFAVSPDEIVITAGAQEALYLALQTVARPGDRVAIEAPCFYSQLQVMQLLGMQAVEVPTDPTDGMDLSELASALKRQRIAACYLMTNFQNPLGSSMPEEKKADLVKLLARHSVPLIEDDVYEELYFAADKPRPAKAFDAKGSVLHCSSFSKCLAPGYRVGWCAAGRFAPRLHGVKLVTTLATNIGAQACIADYLRHGGYDSYLRMLRRRLEIGRDNLLRSLTAHFPPGTRVTRPGGGYFVWVELPPRVSALELHRRAMDAGISIAPGPIFSARQHCDNYIRLNYGHPWSPRLERAMETLGKMVSS
jgi:DNA-binding transcriptional MocR family regulator